MLVHAVADGEKYLYMGDLEFVDILPESGQKLVHALAVGEKYLCIRGLVCVDLLPESGQILVQGQIPISL